MGNCVAGDGMVRGEAKPVFSLHPPDTLAAAGSYGLRDLRHFRQWRATATGSSSVGGTAGAAVGSCRLDSASSIISKTTPAVSAASALLGLVTPFPLIGQALGW